MREIAMNKNKKTVVIGGTALACLMLTTAIVMKNNSTGNLDDMALLSIIKNDQNAFEDYIAAGGKLGSNLDVEGGSYMVGELIVKYERLGFVKYAKSKNMEFDVDAKKAFDVYSLSVAKNNPEILTLLTHKKPNLTAKTYGAKNWSLLHMASSECSHKVIPVLHKAGMNWNIKAKDGSTALTVAAEAGCLQALSYWKEHGADFKAKDGRGMSALSMLSKHKDAAMMAFAESFMPKRTIASVTVAAAPAEPNFYKKRIIPKDQLANRADLIEPEDRPDDANETAEYSEFSD
jgi:hypothetical protein